MAVYTGSQSVLLDAVYDGIEFFMLLPSLFMIPMLYQSSNSKYPYGHMQMESIICSLFGFCFNDGSFYCDVVRTS